MAASATFLRGGRSKQMDDPSISPVRIGTAGWSIAAEAADVFPAEGTSLERYAAILNCVEINSSFHRPHRASTWQRWNDSVPTDFRFSVKLPKTITHQAKLVDVEAPLAAFLAEAGHLGSKLAILLVQLPPSLAFDPPVASAFLTRLRSSSPARIAIEPRHASWFDGEATEMLEGLGIARVGADPARVPQAAVPLVAGGLAYWRLHGSPVIYRSSYADRIDDIAGQMSATPAAERWCIFDNTASSAAISDALDLMKARHRS